MVWLKDTLEQENTIATWIGRRDPEEIEVKQFILEMGKLRQLHSDCQDHQFIPQLRLVAQYDLQSYVQPTIGSQLCDFHP